MLLREQIEALAAREDNEFSRKARAVFDELKGALNRGEVRAAEKSGDGKWIVNSWVKQGLLIGFRIGAITDMSSGESFKFFDKDTYPSRPTTIEDNVRIVPGGSTIRDGAYIAPGVVCMPPMFVNAGAYVDEGTMIDSHALVGSCAQIGKRVHLSAAAQIGGVIEPVGAMPVVIEDDVLVGGNTGIYEGAIVKRRAVIAAGVVLTASTPIYDLPNGTIVRPVPGGTLVVPEGAVVVPGSRSVSVGQGAAWGLSLATPVIVKYRDDRTDARTELEAWIR